MDLLAPCRSCLQCLPFFHLSAPPRVAASKGTSVESAKASENLPSPTPAAAPAVQVQASSPPLRAEGESQDVAYHKAEAVQTSNDAYSAIVECEAVPASTIVIAPPVVSPHCGALMPKDADEDEKPANLPELPLLVPYINDITFLGSGSLHGQSPITPAPFGYSYSGHQYPPAQDQVVHEQHIRHAQPGQEDPQHADETLFHNHVSAQHEHSISQHGHDHSHHGYVDSEDGHVPPQHLIDHEQRFEHSQPIHKDSQHADEISCHDNLPAHHEQFHSHHEHVNSEDGHVPQHSHIHALADHEKPHPDPPSDDSQAIHELHKDALQHDLQCDRHDSAGLVDVGEMVTEHTSFDGKIDNIAPTPHLEVSHSTPELDMEVTIGGENSAGSHTNGASAPLETYYSEPVDVDVVSYDAGVVESPSEILAHGGSHGLPHWRRRDHFKDNLKGLKQQIKQGGLHLKEEGSKHMQTIFENMNKQAQQMEHSARFLNVPRTSNN